MITDGSSFVGFFNLKHSRQQLILCLMCVYIISCIHRPEQIETFSIFLHFHFVNRYASELMKHLHILSRLAFLRYSELESWF